VRHGHVRINDKRLNVPSFQVRVGDTVSLTPKAAANGQVQASVDAVKGRGLPKWLELDAEAVKGKVLSLPARDDVNFPIQEQLIVELYSK
jgi:small subunit ribosomal protein S4